MRQETKERCKMCGKWTIASENNSETFCSEECFDEYYDMAHVRHTLNEC